MTHVSLARPAAANTRLAAARADTKKYDDIQFPSHRHTGDVPPSHRTASQRAVVSLSVCVNVLPVPYLMRCWVFYVSSQFLPSSTNLLRSYIFFLSSACFVVSLLLPILDFLQLFFSSSSLSSFSYIFSLCLVGCLVLYTAPGW